MSAEQLRQLELQRQAARERRAQRSAAAAASSTAPPAAPVAAAPATTSAEARYVDFRLSELKDTRGGFFSGDVSSNSSQYGSNRAMTGTLADGLLSGEQRRRRRHKKSALPERTVIEEQSMELPLEANPPCENCGSFETDGDYYRWFKVRVCGTCRTAEEMYSLVTKTVAKEDFLVTDSEVSKLPSISKPNPHNSNWNDMNLFLYKQVYDYAIAKWGSEDKLNEAFMAKQDKSATRKSAKQTNLFKTHMTDLRKRAKATERINQKLVAHEHTYGPEEETERASGTWSKTCTSCGLVLSYEKL